ncbi:MAG: endonuclease/exonuclease/phosphatase family protein [Candidatus Limiplasma sp.]|nr:endonuclease/exonuclease/phosphatase family protein [Candidatus Limiplasma sp.]
MKIATWNIGSLYKNLESYFNILSKQITSTCPDILCLQEFTGDLTLSKAIYDELGYPYQNFTMLSNNHEMDGTPSGFTMLSKFPFQFMAYFPLRNPDIHYIYNGCEERTYNKGFAKYIIDLRGDPVTLVTGHGIPFHRCQVSEFHYSDIYHSLDEWIAESIEETKEWAIAADFNTDSLSQLCPQIFLSGSDCVGAPTRANGHKHDYIILPSGVKIHHTMNVLGEFDHNYCCVEFDWRDR